MIYKVLLILVMTLLGSIGALYLKSASGNSIKLLIQNKFLYLGGFFYFISALLNIYLLSLMDYTIVLPATSLTYIWTLLLASKFLNETITVNKLIGIILISLGVMTIVLI